MKPSTGIPRSLQRDVTLGVPIDHDYRTLAGAGMNRHEAIAVALERGIADGRIAMGARLPTVRSLSAQLGVSGATVAAAYKLLRERGWTRGEVGRGTFVVAQPSRTFARSEGTTLSMHHNAQAAVVRAPWRRRAVLGSAARLKSLHPDALDCTSGKPDPLLFPADIIHRSFRTAVDETDVRDLQYASPEPVPELAEVLRQRFDRDGISTSGAGFVVGSSAQQLMVLSLTIVPTLLGRESRIVAVEEPGYQTVYDAFEQMGYRLVGMRLDKEGALPHSLESALAAGAHAVLFTPRAQNPYGASWTPARLRDLARVLAAYPNVVAIEDDQFADLARARPGSLINEPQVSERVVYIRSFAKSIAPDVRIAAAMARPRILNLLAEAKSFTDGWSPRLSQRALARLLSDSLLDEALANAREQYGRRRSRARAILAERLSPIGGTVSGDDGLNLWIQLRPGTDAGDVLERAAALGVLCSPGEPFFIRPGRNDVLRMSISGVDEAGAIAAAERLAEAVLDTTTGHARTIPI
jgi:GntR family transcriptional regulator / MocR family aminotransferase